LEKAAREIMEKLEAHATIAILGVSSSDKEMAEFVAEELEFILVDSGSYTVVDRNTLDKIRQEQNLQATDFDENSAVSIGKLLGAGIVITGSITGSGATRRLRLRALNVQTAKVETNVSEPF
jgi:hypothetical protein